MTRAQPIAREAAAHAAQMAMPAGMLYAATSEEPTAEVTARRGSQPRLLGSQSANCVMTLMRVSMATTPATTEALMTPLLVLRVSPVAVSAGVVL